MKKPITLSILCLSVGCSGLFAQSTQSGGGVLGHSPVLTTTGASYIGWDASLFSNVIPLSIEHRGSQRVNFLTGAVQRMTINGTASGATAGFVGIGNFVAPANLLHLSSGANPAYTQISNSTTGNLATDGFHLGVATTGRAEVRQLENLPIDVFTNNVHRATFAAANGFLGIAPNGYFGGTVTPASMIHLFGGPGMVGSAGWRNWMNTGTFMEETTDGMYVGLRNEGPNACAAVINWSNNASGGDRDINRLV